MTRHSSITRSDAVKRATLQYDEADLFRFFDEIHSVFTADYFKNLPVSGQPERQAGLHHRHAAFGQHADGADYPEPPGRVRRRRNQELSGCIGQLRMKFPSLAKFPAMVQTMRPSQFATVADNYLKAISSYSTTAKRVTDKLLSNYYFAGLIATLYPNAKIIHTMRNPVDTCLSSFTKLFKDDMPHSYDLRELGCYYSKYNELMNHWRAVLPPGTMLDVQYEDVVEDPETKAREIVAFCGLEWDPAMPEIPRIRPAGEDGKRLAGAPADLQELGGNLAALRRQSQPARRGPAGRRRQGRLTTRALTRAGRSLKRAVFDPSPTRGEGKTAHCIGVDAI